MEVAAKRRKASAPKAMSQADRIAEAARTERQNAKSLNRWEAEEKKRAEEQKAKLDALKNRKLDGPVITWWSGPSIWQNGRLISTGTRKHLTTKESTGIEKANIKDSSRATTTQPSVTNGEVDVVMKATDAVVKDEITPRQDADVAMKDADSAENEVKTMHDDLKHNGSGSQGRATARGEEASAVVREQPGASSDPSLNEGVIHPTDTPEALSQPEQYSTAMMIPETFDFAEARAPPPSLPPVIEVAARNLIILENVEEGGVRVPEMQNHVLLKRKAMKLPSTIPHMQLSTETN
jgi:vacuolar protein sorting-associated protein 72